MTTADGDNLPPRHGNGKFRQTLDGVERDAKACQLYVEGRTYQQIADELGYGDKSNAHRAISRVLRDTIQAPADELRAREVLRAEEIYLMAREIARKDHPMVSGGKVVYGRVSGISGEVPLTDPGPRLAAMDRMAKSSERVAKLKGLDAPVKVRSLTIEEIQALIQEEEAAIERAASEEGGEE